MENLGKIYQTIVGDDITFFFSLIIVLWLLCAAILTVVPSISSRSIPAKLISITPGSLASLGVLGTFFGILIGLLDFDVTRVDDSVPELLVGLKIAFTTSIVGISAAILFRLIRSFVPSVTSSTGVTPEDIHAALIDIRDNGRTASEQSAKQLDDLRKAISSDGDASLLTQVQKLRTSIQDGHAELIKEFRAFAEHMVENNQKALIEALEQVIRDFNENLTEQFGENFKQLNEAVHKLVDWQENYREHVEKLEQRLDKAVSAVEYSEQSLEQVKRHSEAIPEAIKPLQSVLNGINDQTEVLSAQLEAIGGLRDKAIEAFPVIEANLEKVTKELSSSVEDVVNRSRDALTDSQTGHAQLRAEYQAFISEAKKAQENFQTELANLMGQLAEQSLQEFSKHGDLIEASSKEAQQKINEAWAESMQKMNEQFESFDKAMQDELTRSIELLGQNMASVSEKLVSDYTPLTDRLRQVLEIGRGAS